MMKSVMTEAEKVRRTRRVTYAGMAVNIAIAVAKAVGGVVFSSRALVADAVHSASEPTRTIPTDTARSRRL